MAELIIVPFQPHLPQALPAIRGNLDYRLLREQVLRLDEILLASGLEDQFVRADLQTWAARSQHLSPRAQQRRQRHARRALRCNLLRLLLGEPLRSFASRLADSPLMQHFCLLDELGPVTIPSKSCLQRYEHWWPQEQVQQLMQQLLKQTGENSVPLHLLEELDLGTCFVDSTCLAAPIHYPVDWVLLRDATRTLVKSILLIRQHGLKHRIEAPETFLTRINRLSIQMTQARSPEESQRQRKQILRKMDRLVGTVRAHAQRYRALLAAHWAEETDWTEAQMQQVLRRMDQVLDQLPKARQQARDRILNGRPVDNQEKILSLYEPDARVIVRRKAGAEVEFGNLLVLVENPQGLILDGKLIRESAPADATLLPGVVARLEAAYGRPEAVVTDRGFDSLTNREGLKLEGIYNGMCPRDPQALKEKAKSGKFQQLQKRRAQTEARIGILKNRFLDGGIRSKGFAHRELTLSWMVLTHNLWVLARLPYADPKAEEKQAA